VTLLSMDSFYKVIPFMIVGFVLPITLTNFAFSKVLTHEQHESAARNEYNFDHPDSFDFKLLKETLQSLKQGKKVEVPIYNFVTHRRNEKTVSMYGANVLVRLKIYPSAV